MADKNEPKIRMVTLDKKSPAENSGSRAEERDCDPICLCDHIEKPCVVDPPPCPTVHPCPCVVKPPPCPEHFDCGCMCVRVEPPPCPCVDYVCPCMDKPPDCPKLECPTDTCGCEGYCPGQRRNNQLTPKEGKGKPRTFFKIAENKK